MALPGSTLWMLGFAPFNPALQRLTLTDLVERLTALYRTFPPKDAYHTSIFSPLTPVTSNQKDTRGKNSLHLKHNLDDILDLDFESLAYLNPIVQPALQNRYSSIVQ